MWKKITIVVLRSVNFVIISHVCINRHSNCSLSSNAVCWPPSKSLSPFLNTALSCRGLIDWKTCTINELEDQSEISFKDIAITFSEMILLISLNGIPGSNKLETFRMTRRRAKKVSLQVGCFRNMVTEGTKKILSITA